MQNEDSRKNEEIQKLRSQIKEGANPPKAQFMLDDKSNLFSSSNTIGLSHSTKNADDANKLRRMLMELKNENQALTEENALLKLECKKACDLLIQQRSMKAIKNIETKVDSSLKMLLNGNNSNKNLANNENVSKKTANEISFEDSRVEKPKKYRFVKPKN